MVVLAVAAVIRVGWAIYAARSEPVLLASGDQYSYWYYGTEIARGRGYISYLTGETSAFYPIGYPALLGALYWVVFSTPIPDSLPIITALVHAALGTLTVWLVYVIGRHVWNHRVGLWAAAIMAVFPSAVYTVSTFALEIAFVTACLGALAILVAHDWSAGPPSWARTAAFGLVLAVAVTIRPFALPMLIAFAVGLVMIGAGWRRSLAALGVVVLIIVAVSTPWTIRNAVRFGDFVPISTNLGDTMCMSRFPGSSGSFSWAEHEWCADPDLPEAERNRANIRAALRFIVENPGEEIRLIGRRFVLIMGDDLWSLQEVESNEAGAFLPDGLRQTLRIAANGVWFASIALALIGIGASFTATRRQPSFAMTVVVALSLLVIPLGLWGAPRFHAPLVPFFALFAAVGITGLLGLRVRPRPDAPVTVPVRDTSGVG